MNGVTLAPSREVGISGTMPQLVRILHLTFRKSDVAFCRQLLLETGYMVDAQRVTTEAEFRACLRNGNVSLIVCSYPLPGFDAALALQIAAEACPIVPFIFYAPSPGEETIIDLLKRGAVDFVLEDNPQRFPGAVQEALQRAELRRNDLLDREDAERARRWLAAIVESSEDAIIRKDLQGIITGWNAGAMKIFGYTADEVLGKPITILLPPDRLHEEETILGRLRRGESIDHLHTIRVTKDRAQIDVSLSVSPVQDKGGKILGVSKIARDITAQKAAEKSLQEAHQQLAEYAEHLQRQVADRTTRLEGTIQSLAGVCYHIAHDLRAPVRSVRGFTDLLLESHGDVLSATGKGFIDRIIQACSRMELLIQDLLAYGRLSHTELICKWVHLDAVLKYLLQQNSAELEARGASIQVQDPLPPVWGNPNVLEQILGNILSNALKYVKPGVAPQIRISAQEESSLVRITIEDNGIGIAPVHHQRIFHMFERLHPDSDYPGTGIGLAIVQKGVQRLNGRITVESDLGKGSRFTIEIPKPALVPLDGKLPAAA